MIIVIAMKIIALIIITGYDSFFIFFCESHNCLLHSYFLYYHTLLAVCLKGVYVCVSVYLCVCVHVSIYNFSCSQGATSGMLLQGSVYIFLFYFHLVIFTVFLSKFKDD